MGKRENTRVRYFVKVMKASAVSTIGKRFLALKCGSNRHVSVTENDERTVSLIKDTCWLVWLGYIRNPPEGAVHVCFLHRNMTTERGFFGSAVVPGGPPHPKYASPDFALHGIRNFGYSQFLPGESICHLMGPVRYLWYAVRGQRTTLFVALTYHLQSRTWHVIKNPWVRKKNNPPTHPPNNKKSNKKHASLWTNGPACLCCCYFYM